MEVEEIKSQIKALIDGKKAEQKSEVNVGNYDNRIVLLANISGLLDALLIINKVQVAALKDD